MKKGNKSKRKENRELRNKKVQTTDNEMIKLLKIIGAIVAFLAVFLIIAHIFNDKGNEPEDTSQTIQYAKILATNILMQEADDYYVLVEMKDDEYLSLYNWYLGTYTVNDETGKYYIVDLNDAFNKWAVADANTLDVDNIEKIRFSETVLLKISDKKITDSYVGVDNIKTHLEKISAKEES